MTNRTQDHASRFLPVLLLLFAGSGCSALIYEIVWYHLLQLAIGSTSVSLGILLATFMGGLCIGSIFFPRMVSRSRHPLKVYAVLEVGIAVLGILVLFGMPFISRAYIAGAESGLPGMLLRGAIAAICMLPATILMGASLPAISRWVESTPAGVSWWGLLYGSNTVGAVAGCLLAGFYLIRLYDVGVATYAAAVINILVAVVSLVLAALAPVSSTSEAAAPSEPAPKRAEGDWAVYVTIAISGACALGAEVVWTRLMGMMMGATVYVFAIILAVFLTGLALGSGFGSAYLGSIKSPLRARLALGWCQILLTLGIAWTAYAIADLLPYWAALTDTDPVFTLKHDLLRCLFGILPPTILWGASFPLALAAVASPDEDSGRTVGRIYAANTFGAIIGALVVSLSLIPWIGTQQTQRVLLVLSALSALLVLLPYASKSGSKMFGTALTASMLVALLLAFFIDPIPGELIAYGRRLPNYLGQTKVLYTVEGRNSSVAITQWNDGAIEVDVNGHVEATTEIYDMKLQRMVGHLPAILHPNPKSVLGIGFGAGVSAGTFTRYPGIEHITVCEIEPVIPPTSTRYFAREDYDVLHNPRTRIIYDDARHYVMTTKEKYDIIASDPLDVFVKGTAALYSKEYFDAVKAHLNPGGMFSLYVPLYETDEITIKSELATFFESFPYGTVWANLRDGEGYDMVFMGQLEPLKINLDEIAQRLNRPDYQPVVESLQGVGVNSMLELFMTYAGQAKDMAPWLKGSDINRDNNLRLQYLAGWGINSKLEDYLYRQILIYRKPPVSIFSGSPGLLQPLMSVLSQP